MSNRYNNNPGILRRPKVCLSEPPIANRNDPSGPCSLDISPPSGSQDPFPALSITITADDLDAPTASPIQWTWSTNRGTLQAVTLNGNRETSFFVFNKPSGSGTAQLRFTMTSSLGCYVSANVAYHYF